MPEFKRTVLEVMRQPLEDRSDDFQSEIFGELSCKFYVGASMNPSPSGYFPDDPTSSQFEMQRYMNKLSGPLLDRIDIHIEVQKSRIRATFRQKKRRKQYCNSGTRFESQRNAKCALPRFRHQLQCSNRA